MLLNSIGNTTLIQFTTAKREIMGFYYFLILTQAPIKHPARRFKNVS